MVQKKAREILEELEQQFHGIQSKISKAKESYLSNHREDYEKAQATYKSTKKKLDETRKKVAHDAARIGKSGSKAAQNQLKKTMAVATLLGDALGEARDIMTTAQEKLSSAKPFEKKLAARAKALAAFEKEWDAEQKAAEKKKVKKSKKHKVPAKKQISKAKKITSKAEKKSSRVEKVN